MSTQVKQDGAHKRALSLCWQSGGDTSFPARGLVYDDNLKVLQMPQLRVVTDALLHEHGGARDCP